VLARPAPLGDLRLHRLLSAGPRTRQSGRCLGTGGPCSRRMLSTVWKEMQSDSNTLVPTEKTASKLLSPLATQS